MNLCILSKKIITFFVVTMAATPTAIASGPFGDQSAQTSDFLRRVGKIMGEQGNFGVRYQNNAQSWSHREVLYYDNTNSRNFNIEMGRDGLFRGTVNGKPFVGNGEELNRAMGAAPEPVQPQFRTPAPQPAPAQPQFRTPAPQPAPAQPQFRAPAPQPANPQPAANPAPKAQAGNPATQDKAQKPSASEFARAF